MLKTMAAEKAMMPPGRLELGEYEFSCQMGMLRGRLIVE